MFLSQLRLNVRSAAVRRDVASSYQMHASLCRALAAPDQKPPRFLWRLETTQMGESPKVLLQSEQAPNWQGFVQQEAFADYFVELPQAKVVPIHQLETGQVLRFRLRANPTVSKKVGDGSNPRGKRRGITAVEEQLAWLQRQGQQGGFAVLGAMVVQSQRVRMQKHQEGAPIVLQAVLYEGHLRIAHLEDFLQTLQRGLGHAKALGFGLLSIAK